MQEELQNSEEQELVAGFSNQIPPKTFVTQNAKSVLTFIRDIDGTVAGETTLYTVPSGKVLIDPQIVVISGGIDTVTVLPTISVGVTPTWDNIYNSITLSAGMDTEMKMQVLDTASNQIKPLLVEDEVIKVAVETPATATEYTFSVVLMGTLFSATA